MLARLASVSLLLLLPISAATIYSNFSAGDTFTHNAGFPIGDSGGTVDAWAQEFSPSGNSFTLDKVELAFVTVFPPTGNDLTITVSSSDISGLPGTVLESFDVVNALGSNVIVAADSSIHPLLVNGVSYWLTAAFTNPSTTDDALWNFSNNGSAVFSDSAQQQNGGAWQAQTETMMGVFRISGTAVAETPEPGTVALVGFGLAAIGLACARRKRLGVK